MQSPSLNTVRRQTPLEKLLIEQIRQGGPISISDFMELALTHSEYGYYSSQEPFGREGDFTTAPEISQVFGELIGAWLIDSWQNMGSPISFNLVELGPGRGTLMSDIIRTASIRPKFLESADIFLVENSQRLRKIQEDHLAQYGLSCTWIDALNALPQKPTLFIANEFFDCMPVKQFVRSTAKQEPAWQEKMIGVTEDSQGPQLAFCLNSQLTTPPGPLPKHSKPEDILEVSQTSIELMQHISSFLTDVTGHALLIDYGYNETLTGDSLQAMRKHQYWPVLQSIGLADLTAHVNFSTLSKAGQTENTTAYGPIFQSQFLIRLGIEARAIALAKTVEEAKKQEIKTSIEKLIHPDHMGTLFKCLCISSKNLPSPAGF